MLNSISVDESLFNFRDWLLGAMSTRGGGHIRLIRLMEDRFEGLKSQYCVRWVHTFPKSSVGSFAQYEKF